MVLSSVDLLQVVLGLPHCLFPRVFRIDLRNSGPRRVRFQLTESYYHPKSGPLSGHQSSCTVNFPCQFQYSPISLRGVT